MEKASLDISRKEELVKTVRSFPVCTKFHKRFREKDAVKNACNGVATALEFIKTGNYFYFNSFISLLKTVLFIWLNPLGPGVHSSYYQSHLIYP